jgi:hypothetical protein
METPTYYILRGQDVNGPFTVSQLCSMWNSGEVPKDTLYSEEGYDKWLQLRFLMEEDNAARAAMTEQSTAERRTNSRYVPRVSWIHRMEGVAGVLEVFEDKVTITPTGVLGVLTKGLKGTKTIPFFSISAIQFKNAGFTSGYIQFTIPGGNESRGGVFDAAGDENTFMFSNNGMNNQIAEIIKNYIESRIQELRSPKPVISPNSGGIADEIKKLADLKAQGVLSDSEFQAAKAKLLGA